MSPQAELTPAQLAALDLIIAQKQEAGANADLSFIGGITNILTKVVPVVVKVTPVVTPAVVGMAAAAEKTPQAADAASALDQLDKLSLEQLMEVRKNVQAK